MTYGRRYAPRRSIDVLDVFDAVGYHVLAAIDVARRGRLGLVARRVLVLLGLARGTATRRHARDATSLPELVLHYVIAAFTWSRDEVGDDRSALGRVTRSVVALGLVGVGVVIG